MTAMNQSRQEIEASLIEQANQDPAFRQALLSDPKGTLATFLGMTLPEKMNVTILEEEPGHHYLVLPPAPPSLDALPLDDLELALAGGGRTLRPMEGQNKRSNVLSSTRRPQTGSSTSC